MNSLVTEIKDQELMKSIEYFFEMKEHYGHETVWSIHECDDINDDAPLNIDGKTLTYEIVRDDVSHEMLMASLSDSTIDVMKTVSVVVKGKTYRALWNAAEKLVLESGTHHRYIEDFLVEKDGTITLVTGS